MSRANALREKPFRITVEEMCKVKCHRTAIYSGLSHFAPAAMKKATSLILSVILILSLSGCIDAFVEGFKEGYNEGYNAAAKDSDSISASLSTTIAEDAPVTEKVTVESVVDGDTIWVLDEDHNRLKIRIIGVDAPETPKADHEGEPYAEEAQAFAEQCLDGQVIYLERDVSDTDQYDRTLRYVWLDKPTDNDSSTFERLNFSALLVRGGYASVVVYGDDDKYYDALKTLENSAITDQLGMWMD